MRNSIVVTMILNSLMLFFCPRSGMGGTLSTEILLPLHDEKDAYTPSVEYGKERFLVIWQSGRMGEGSLVKRLVYGADLVGCRVDREGKVLDKKAFVISSARDLQEKPDIAFGNSVFFAVWQDSRNGKDYDVYGARITPEGRLVDGDGILVSGGPHNQCLPRVAWDGKAFQVVWQDWRSAESYEIYGARVLSDGKLLDPEGVALKKRYRSISGGDRCSPAITSKGDGKSLVFWCSHWRGGTSGGMMVSDGKAIDDNAYVYDSKSKGHGPGLGSHPISLAAGPDGYFAAWMTKITAGRSFGAGASSAMVLDSTGKHVKYLFLAGKQHYTRRTDVVWDGSSYAATWIERIVVRRRRGQAPHDNVFLTRISQKGKPLGPIHSMEGTFESPVSKPAVASDKRGLTFIAYERHPKTAEVPIKIGFRMLTKQVPQR